ncbi:MAG: PIN domain-containing protein [Archaeoglobaceae archaeon]
MERNKTLRVCLDTNVFIEVKNREEGYEYCERILDAIDDGLIEAFVSPIVISEVLVGFYRNKEEFEAKNFMNTFCKDIKSGM